MSAHDTHARSRGRSTLKLTLVCGVLGLIAAFTLFELMRDHSQLGALKPLTPSSVDAPASDAAPTRVAVETKPAPRVESTGPVGVPAVTRGVPRVEGRVHARGGVAIAGAHVSIDLAVGDDVQRLGFATSGTDGNYALELPKLEGWPTGAGEVRVQADALHFRPGRLVLPLAATHDPFVVRADVRLEQGERLSGRVVDRALKPVRDATVVLSVESIRNGITNYVTVEELRTKNDGSFDAGFTSSARYHVAARAEGIGTAFKDALELEAGVAQNLGDLVLKGGAAISGTITHADGTPAGDFELWAIDGNFANDPNGLALAAMKAPETERGDGLAYTRTFSDAAGRYSLGGLRPGQYALRTPDTHAILEPHQSRFEPGTEKLELKVMSSRLTVRVVDEHGAPVRSASVRLTDLSTLTDGSYQAAGTRTEAVHGPDGVAAFVVEPESPVAVQAFTATRTSAEEVTILAQNQFTHEIVLVVSNAIGEGRLILDVQGADGHALTNLWVSVLSSVTKARHEELGTLETDAEGRLPPIPAGTYQLLIGFAPGTDRNHFPVRTSAPLVVKAGETTTLALRAQQGGRMAVTLSVRGEMPPGFELKLPANPSVSERRAAQSKQRAHFGTNVSIRPTTGGPLRPLHFRDAAGTGLWSEILPGETLTTEDLIEPGTYDVAIESLTFATTATTSVRVDAGRAADTTIPVRLR